MEIKDFIKNIVNVSEKLIEKFEDYKELTGEEKKHRLDDTIEKHILNTIDLLEINFVLKWAFKKLLVANIPDITQAIFDLIQTRIIGITK